MDEDMSIDTSAVDTAADATAAAETEATADSFSAALTDAGLDASNATDLNANIFGSAAEDYLTNDGKLVDSATGESKDIDDLTCHEKGQMNRALQAMGDDAFDALTQKVDPDVAAKLKALEDATVKPEASSGGGGGGGSGGADKKKKLGIDLDGDGKPDVEIDPETGKITTMDGKEVGQMDPAKAKSLDKDGDGKLTIGDEIQQSDLQMAMTPQTGGALPAL